MIGFCPHDGNRLDVRHECSVCKRYWENGSPPWGYDICGHTIYTVCGQTVFNPDKMKIITNLCGNPMPAGITLNPLMLIDDSGRSQNSVNCPTCGHPRTTMAFHS